VDPAIHHEVKLHGIGQKREMDLRGSAPHAEHMPTVMTPPASTRRHVPRLLGRWFAAAVPLSALVLVASAVVPTVALVVGVGLGLVVGGVAGAGVGFVAADSRRGLRVAVATAAVAVPVVVAGAGLVALLGPVSVGVLPAVTTVVGLVWWVRRAD
jgi:hypothetical protein